MPNPAGEESRNSPTYVEGCYLSVRLIALDAVDAARQAAAELKRKVKSEGSIGEIHIETSQARAKPGADPTGQDLQSTGLGIIESTGLIYYPPANERNTLLPEPRRWLEQLRKRIIAKVRR